uniref:Uncharacterized protein n=1 Tax=Arundo donax TaxID=35708 RepID=A0A0A9GX31_ARUDO
MVDEPLDACSRTDVDGERPSRNNKRKSSQACSYPNKKDGFIVRNARERYVIGVLAAVVFMVIYFFTEEEENEEEWELEEENGEEEEEKEEDVEEEEEEDKEGDKEEEEEDEDSRADLLGAAVDLFRATKAWAERELGSESTNCEEILGMLWLIPGYDEVVKAKHEAVKAK